MGEQNQLGRNGVGSLPAGTVAQCWDTAAAARSLPRGWLDHRYLFEHQINAPISGAPESPWLDALTRRLGISPTSRWVSFGCGCGNAELGAAARGLCAAIDAYDISAASLEVARRQARDWGVPNVTFHQLDWAHYEPPPAAYDVVFMSMSLHHVADLDRLYTTVEQTLRPGGLFVFIEYVGPRQQQLSDRQVRIVADLLAALPEKLRTDVDSGQIKRHWVGRSVEEWNLVDPSEAVYSDLIRDSVARRFEVVERWDVGGTVLGPLLEHIIHNFSTDDDHHQSLLELLATFEQVLIREGVLLSDFTVMAVRPRLGAADPAPLASDADPEQPEIDRLRRHVAALQQQLQAVETSTVWRVAQGLRRLIGRAW